MDTKNAEFETVEEIVSNSSQQLPSIGSGLDIHGEGGDVASRKRSRSRSAICWTSNWFIPLDPKFSLDGRPRAQCSKCKQLFLADPSKNGTSTLNNHMKRCPNRENKEINQMFLQQSGGKLNLRDLKINSALVREMVLTLIVNNELPLKFVEYEEFRKLMLYVYPGYNPINPNQDQNEDGEELSEALRDVLSVPDNASKMSIATTVDSATVDD
ncbi:hypothetical protein NE237_021721 [Protea cynaroides]|uniref:BED-type domain-containing protein n=1 Tax=Protea cynaroides TaxID=273540 RepID=A0A9Q0HAS0_9MAGN|nr:hypothetical protein NE237_021721 [Protea cynaroides]